MKREHTLYSSVGKNLKKSIKNKQCMNIQMGTTAPRQTKAYTRKKNKKQSK